MSSSETVPDASSGVPDPELVRALMGACNCDERRAVQLLKVSPPLISVKSAAPYRAILTLEQLNENDVQRAQWHHEAYLKFVRAKKPLPSTNSSRGSPYQDQEAASSNQSDSEASSTHAVSTDTPTSEEESSKDSNHPPTFSNISSVNPNQEEEPRDQRTMPAPDNVDMPLDPDARTSPEVLPSTTPLPALKDLSLNERAAEDEPEELPDWDFILPETFATHTLFQNVADEDDGFEPDALAGAVHYGATVVAARNYLDSFDPRLVKEHINDEVDGFPPIFYAVATNSESMVRLFIEFGAEASAVHRSSQVPLLAFAIVNSETLQADTTAIVSTLLCHGASPHVIPKDIFTPYTRDTSVSPNSNTGEEMEVTELTAWCNDGARMKLAKAANISHRYFLERATKLKKPSKKRRQVAQLRNAENLLGIPYFLVGQSVATEMLIQRLLTHLMMPTKRPLVLCFAGPSGHGKTELARQLGHLLSLDLEVVDCTIVQREMELFGAREPFVGAEKGSPVNNFLAEHAGKRCIVFFDEFEKTTSQIHQALLLPFDNGR